MAEIRRVLVLPGSPTVQRSIEQALVRHPGVQLIPWRVAKERLLARAVDRPDTIATVLTAARRQYVSQQFKEMTEALLGVERDHLARLRSKQAASLNLLLGVALAAREQRAQATERFQLALRLDPTSSLDPAIYPPAIIALFRQAKEESRDVAPVLLRVHATPAARIVLDGQDRGRSPAGLTVPIGRHYLVLQQFAYRTLATVLVVNTTRELRQRLEPLGSSDREQQLREMVINGTFDAGERDQLGALGRSAQASHVLVWREVNPDVVQATLVCVGIDGPGRTASVQRGAVDELWLRLTGERQIIRPPTPAPTPLWKQWWLWSAVAVVVSGLTAGIAAWQLHPDPEIRIQVR